VGSFYGARLALAAHETHFLLRSDFEKVRRNGVSVCSPQGDFHVRPKCARLPEEIGPVDLVLIGLKTTANSEFGRLLHPLVGPATAILTLQNGLGNEAQLARLFPVEQILGGLCFVCLNRIEPGIIHHIAHGAIFLGEFERWPEPRTHDIAGAFRHAGVPCTVTDNLARTHWEKLVWNIPFNGLGVAAAAGFEALDSPGSAAWVGRHGGPCMTTDELLAEERWALRVRQLMLEVIAAARALGLDVAETLADKQIERTRTMGAYRASTLVDFERGQPLELESLFMEPLRQGRRAGLPMPMLSALCAVLERLDKTAAAFRIKSGS